MHDFPTLMALSGGSFYLLVTVCMCWYASQHYTREPGGKWTTWEKAQSPPQVASEQQEAA